MRSTSTPNGGWSHETPSSVAIVPELPGCITQGDTLEEALANAREAAELTLEDMDSD